VSHGLPETPWGGFKESGSEEHSRLGFDEMTQPQVVVDDILSFTKKDIWWHPYSESLYRGIAGMADALYSPKLVSRISGLLRLMRILPRFFGKG
jgi:succinate-semialdehyde dehydrogenase/glutarate-semialdehyde dehydrogenase